jgi:hypothetical protein
MVAAIQGMRRIIANAQQSMKKTRSEIMGGITDELKGKPKGSSDLGAPPPPSGFQVIE